MEQQQKISVNVEEPSKTKRILKVEVPAETIQPELQKTYQAFQKRAQFPGFRKGKVPLTMIRKRLGREVQSDLLQRVVPLYYEQAVRESALEPVDMPILQNVSLEEGEPLRFDATVYIKPDFELQPYKNIPLVSGAVAVSEEMIDKVIEDMRERLSQLSSYEDADHVVETGDVVEADFEGFLDGEPFEGGQGSRHLVEIGQGRMIPGFEDGFIGMKKGEHKEIEATFPEEYHAPHLAGKTVIFKVVLHDVKKKSLPDVDDEFAKDVGEQFETLAALRAGIRERIEKNESRRVREKLRGDVMDEVLKRHSFELPEIMVQRHKSYLGDRMQKNPAREASPLSPADQKWLDEQADRDVAWSLISEKIAEAEGITLSAEEFEEGLEKQAQESGMTKEVLKDIYTNEVGSLEPLRLSLLNEKILDFLVENATVTTEGTGDET